MVLCARPLSQAKLSRGPELAASGRESRIRWAFCPSLHATHAGISTQILSSGPAVLATRPSAPQPYPADSQVLGIRARPQFFHSNIEQA